MSESKANCRHDWSGVYVRGPVNVLVIDECRKCGYIRERGKDREPVSVELLRERDALVTSLANLSGSIPAHRKGLSALAQGHLREARKLTARIFDSAGEIDHGALNKIMEETRDV